MDKLINDNQFEISTSLTSRHSYFGIGHGVSVIHHFSPTVGQDYKWLI